MNRKVNRRTLIAGVAAGVATASLQSRGQEPPRRITRSIGGETAAVPKPMIEWPVWNQVEETEILGVLHSGKWGRTTGGEKLRQFETAFAERMMARHCIATSSGTTALLTTLGALGIGPGDEVIMPPYTFVATFNAITSNYALPVFVDSDIETFQIDPNKIAARVNDQTRLIMPVHIGGSPADLDGVKRVADARKIPVIEDACQAPMAQWRGQPVGTIGLGGCFSFQASKNITSGEGGAIITNDEDFANRCYDFHTPGGAKKSKSLGRGSNFRLTEFQAGLLVAQMTRQEEHCQIRDSNAAYLSEMLAQIPGIKPAKLTPGTTRSAWHLYMFRYDSEAFAGLTRGAFLKELGKLGVTGASTGYNRLNESDHVRALAANPHYQRIYGKEFMNRWFEQNQCPENDRLCDQAVWFSQTKLLSDRQQMELIAKSIADIQRRAPMIVKQSS